jgi:hypothetical protein
MKLFNHVLELDFRALRKWSDLKVFTCPYYTHVVWGKMSLIYGQPHLEPVRVCAHCYEEIKVLNAGDEWLDYCEDCHQVEGKTLEITMEEYEARQ